MNGTMKRINLHAMLLNRYRFTYASKETMGLGCIPYNRIFYLPDTIAVAHPSLSIEPIQYAWQIVKIIQLRYDSNK